MLKGLTNWKILNSREVKEIAGMVKRQWDADFSEATGDAGMLEGTDGDIFLISRDIEKIELEKLRINSLGLYFGQLRNDELRLSIEGSQLLGRFAKKNVAELNSDEMRQWVKGEEIAKELPDCSGFVIIRHNGDFLGSGKYKEGKILNYFPKARRIVNI